MTDFSALFGLLGGAGEGALHGYDTAQANQLHQAQLAETSRHNQALEAATQMPLSQFYQLLGMPAPSGVDVNQSVPIAAVGHAMPVAERERARVAELDRKAKVGNELSVLNNQATSLAAIPATDTEAQARLYGAGANTPEIKELMDIIHPKGVALNPGQILTHPYTGKEIARGGPVQGRSAQYIAEHAGMVADWQMDPSRNPAPGTPEFDAKLRDLMSKKYPLAPGQEYRTNKNVSGYPETNQTGPSGPTVQHPIGQTFDQFAADARRTTPGITDGQIQEMWDNLLKDYTKQPTTATFKDKSGAPAPAPGQQGVQAAPKTQPNGSTVDRDKLPGEATIKDVAHALQYARDTSVLADRIEAWHAKQAKEGVGALGRAGMAGRNIVNELPIVGSFAKAAAPLDREAAEILAEASRLLREYEQATGGMRAVSGPQIQAALTSVHGGDALSNPNSFINLRNLAHANIKKLAAQGEKQRESGYRDISTPKGEDASIGQSGWGKAQVVR